MLLTVVVDHDFDIAEDLAVPPVGLVAGLSHAGQALPVEGAMGLGVEHKGHGQQALDPFCAWSAMFHLVAVGTELPMNWSRR